MDARVAEQAATDHRPHAIVIGSGFGGREGIA
jgi:hypothetical protein